MNERNYRKVDVSGLKMKVKERWFISISWKGHGTENGSD